MSEQYITKEGLEELKQELDYLKTEKTREIAALLKHTMSFGDLKENAAYHDAKDKQMFLQDRIRELEDKIRNAAIIEKKKTGKVEIGSKILLSINNDKESMEIVGPTQADPLKGKISYESPIGKAVLNKTPDQEFEVNINRNKLKCKVLKIE